MAGAGQMKDKKITIRVTSEQLRLLDQRAKRCGVKVSRWMRSILLQAATRQSSEGYLRIKEPDGVTD
jgi:predicted DNA binding CopG/RHH family protein